jgi:hypothetical protein
MLILHCDNAFSPPSHNKSQLALDWHVRPDVGVGLSCLNQEGILLHSWADILGLGSHFPG